MMDFTDAMLRFNTEMVLKFRAREAKNGDRSILRMPLLECDPIGLTSHFWDEVREWSEDWENPAEGIDVANMAFLRWWYLTEKQAAQER